MYRKPRKELGRQNWDRIWLDEYRHFLQLEAGEAFTIETSQVISFLIEIKGRGKKAWQRMQALKAIKTCAASYFHMSTDHLDDVTTKLQTLVDKERAAIEAENPPEIRHTIDPNEPVVIQKLRRHLRMKHNPYGTEKSYVLYANQFVRRFQLVLLSKLI